jgi:multiple sugar transport system ATP-binding protein
MMGSELFVHVTAVGKECVLRIATIDLPAENRRGFKFGDQLHFTFDGALTHIFDPETTQNLL